METFKAGFSRTVITPPNGTPISGYFFERLATGALDDLELNTVAVTDGGRTVILIVADLLMISLPRMETYRKAVAQGTGVPMEAVFISCTHTHTGPEVGMGQEYASSWERTLSDYLVTGAQLAMEDLADAQVETAQGRVDRISFIRRFFMKDGSVRTNPGVGNPDIRESIGQPDESLQLIVLKRPGEKDIALVNFQVHPDVIGGTRFSADYPGFVRRIMENALDRQAFCVYINGAQGDTNHLNTAPGPGDAKGLTEVHFDGLRGYEYSRNMGRAIAGEAIKLFGRTAAAKRGPVRFAQRSARIPSNRPAAEDLPEAKRIADLHNAGRDDQLPWKDMELTTAVAEALRMVALKDGPDEYDLKLTAFTLGDVAVVGIPGEPFTEIGRQIKKQSPYPTTLVWCVTNGAEGYFPTREAYDQGGYEARSSFYRRGVAEIIIREAGILLDELHRG